MCQPDCKNIPSQRVNFFREASFPFVLSALCMGSAEPGALQRYSPPGSAEVWGQDCSLDEQKDMS